MENEVYEKDYGEEFREGFNTPFELQFLRKRPRAVFREKGS